MMHKDYLLKHKKVMFMILLSKGELWQYLSKIDKQAEEMFSRLVSDMAKAEGVTEQLKATNQMEWVACMNNIEARARERVYNELVFT